MHIIFNALREHPEIALYLTLAMGFAFGALKFGSFSLGVVPSTLIAGLIVGQLGITLPDVLEQTFFLGFLFAVGYSVGPQFFSSLKRDGLPQVLFTLIICASGLLTAWAAAKAMGYGPGVAAGMLAGGYTNSGTLGVAAANIGRIGLNAKVAASQAGLIGIAYAVTLPFSFVLTTWFITAVAPKILRIDLPKVSKELEDKMGVHEASADEQAYRPIGTRAYRLANPALADRTPRELATALQGAVVTRFRKGTEIVDADMHAAVPHGATLVLAGPPHALFVAKDVIGPEVEDKELLVYAIDEIDIVVTRKEAVGQTVAQLEAQELDRYGRRLFLLHVTRAGEPLAPAPDLRLERSDVLRIRGDKKHVEALAKAIGYADRATTKSDVAFMAIGTVVGGLVGLITVHIGGVPLSLSAGVGTLLGGLVWGYLRAKYRTFGAIPAPALWVFNNVGLNGFIAAIGLNAALGLVSGLKTYGLGLALCGLATAFVPMIVGLIVGKYVFKMHPTLLLGAIAGARTNTPALGALQLAAQSSLPAVGYSLPFALGRIILAVFGVAILLLTK